MLCMVVSIVWLGVFMILTVGVIVRYPSVLVTCRIDCIVLVALSPLRMISLKGRFAAVAR